MAAYQFYNPAPVLSDLLGLKPASGGKLYFYSRGTTTPLDTYNTPEADTPNANPVQLDSAGRANTPIFLDGEYTVVCKDSGGATIWTRDVVSGAAAGATIPALETGKFLTNDGTNLIWADVRQMPDPTGSENQMPVTDGSGYVLQDVPAPIDPEIVVDTNKFQAGVSTDETKFLIQMGADSAPASGTFTTTKSVAFTTPYAVAPKVIAWTTSSSQPAGPTVAERTAVSTTGFTYQFDVAEGDTGDASIVNPIPFEWIAFGNIEVTPP